MQYTQLPVYKACYDLLLDVFLSSQTMKREYRYTLGEELKKDMMRLMVCVYRANLTRGKERNILKAREHIEVIKLMVRLKTNARQKYGKNHPLCPPRICLPLSVFTK